MKIKAAAGAEAGGPIGSEVECDRTETGKVRDKGRWAGTQQGRGFHGFEGNRPGSGLGKEDGSGAVRAEQAVAQDAGAD